jgi:hypothetical protein
VDYNVTQEDYPRLVIIGGGEINWRKLRPQAIARVGPIRPLIKSERLFGQLNPIAGDAIWNSVEL